MTVSKERLAAARALILDVLNGRVTPESDAMLFEEDLVLFSARLVEKEDRQWLLAQLANPQYPLTGRLEVVRNLRDSLGDALAILRRQHPDVDIGDAFASAG